MSEGVRKGRSNATESGKDLTLALFHGPRSEPYGLAEELSDQGLPVETFFIIEELLDWVEAHRQSLVLVDSVDCGIEALRTLNYLNEACEASHLALVCRNDLPTQRNMVDAMRLGVRDVIECADGFLKAETQIRALLSRFEADEFKSGELKRHLQQIERDQESGRFIQRRLLPTTPFDIGTWRLSHRLVPSLMLSGDFVDYFRLNDDCFCFYMADVSGHGASSAFVTVMIKDFVRRLARTEVKAVVEDPSRVLHALNQDLLLNDISRIGKHVSMHIGVVDTARKRLRYANAGHFPTLLISDACGTRFLEQAGRPLGLFPEAQFESEAYQLDTSQPLLIALFSDGVLELMGRQPLPNKEAALKQTAGHCRPSGEEIWDSLEFDASSQCRDDVSFLSLHSRAAA
ncbi:MAG: SpoIIE family protein phosphatase [Gammaproteobacteria bacterium]|nr:SpoIIE family protein phosphatase [Gammaproteobacteria bacterium]